jgi:hypothetical protein
MTSKVDSSRLCGEFNAVLREKIMPLLNKKKEKKETPSALISIKQKRGVQNG